MPPDSLSRGRAAMMSLATLLLVAACGDHDTTPLEAAAPSTSTAEPAASGTVPAVQARNTWTRQTDIAHPAQQPDTRSRSQGERQHTALRHRGQPGG